MTVGAFLSDNVVLLRWDPCLFALLLFCFCLYLSRSSTPHIFSLVYCRQNQIGLLFKHNHNSIVRDDLSVLWRNQRVKARWRCGASQCLLRKVALNMWEDYVLYVNVRTVTKYYLREQNGTKSQLHTMPEFNSASYNGLQHEIRVCKEMKYRDVLNTHGIWATVQLCALSTVACFIWWREVWQLDSPNYTGGDRVQAGLRHTEENGKF